MLKFYICRTCGNLIEMIEDTGVVPSCCGEDMEELIPASTDGKKEKHVPVCAESNAGDESKEARKDDTKADDVKSQKCCTQKITVRVGSEPHPMDASHCIEWIVVLTDKGAYRQNLDLSQKAEATFCLHKDEKVKALFSYCNLHGLWMNAIH